ncbi:SRPBCC family protein [Streptomyces sp. 4N124]|uniref:SRPBCC family protein n=1 Tax=Streptomyces sp. 4N124 TaxID=3457420 RepID=UPI003FCF8966
MASVENVFEVAAPLAFVWNRLNDVRSWPTLFTEYRSVEVLEEEASAMVFRLTMHPDENGRTWSWVSRREWDRAARTVRAHRIETGPFEYMRLLWTFEPLEEDSTRVTWHQDFRMRPDAPLDDAAMTARMNKNMPEQQRIVARRIEAARRAVQTFDGTKAQRARGGDMRTTLSPATVGCATGISGIVRLAPGEQVDEHYHPYSEEHLHLTEGRVVVDLDGEPVPLEAGSSLLVPRFARHRVRNPHDGGAALVFALSPLAPRPELGHVTTESAPAAEVSAR